MRQSGDWASRRLPAAWGDPPSNAIIWVTPGAIARRAHDRANSPSAGSATALQTAPPISADATGGPWPGRLAPERALRGVGRREHCRTMCRLCAAVSCARPAGPENRRDHPIKPSGNRRVKAETVVRGVVERRARGPQGSGELGRDLIRAYHSLAGSWGVPRRHRDSRGSQLRRSGDVAS
jgi:hypothetical protein